MNSPDDTEPFAALSDVARSVRAVRRDLTQLRADARVAARSARAIATWSRSLPRLTVDPSDNAVGDEVLHGLADHQPWPFRYRAVAVMTLPASFELYLRGRSRQAVRTGRRRAHELGLTAVPCDGSGTGQRLLDTMLDRREFYPTIDDRLRRQVETGLAQIWFVTTATGDPVAMASAVVDQRLAQLAIVQVALDVPDRSAIRYLLSSELVHGLVEQGVDHLVADSMLLLPPGVVYLQERLGFEPTNIDVPRHRRPPRGTPGPTGTVERRRRTRRPRAAARTDEPAGSPHVPGRASLVAS